MSASVITAITNTFTDSQYMKPDIALILTIDDIDLARSRVSQRGELENPDPFEVRPDDFQQRVRDGYVAIANEFNIPTINAAQSIDDVAAQIFTYVDQQL